MKKGRNEEVDAIKAFAIVCVVIGHCIQFGSGQDVFLKESFFEDYLFRFIYSFHMPLFMLISGYLFAYSSRNRTFRNNLGKKIRTLIVPIFSWAVILLGIRLISLIVHREQLPRLGEIVPQFWFIFLRCQWFLWALFWCTIIVLVNKTLFKDSLIVYLLFFVLVFFLPAKYNVSLYGFMYPYFVVGYLYNKDWKDRLSPILINKSFLLVTWIVFIGLFFFFRRGAYIYTSGINIIKEGTISLKQLGVDIYRFLIGFIGSLAVIGLIRTLYPLCKSSLFRKSISYVGMNTLGIYIISGVVFNEHLLKVFSKGFEGINYGIVFLESIVVILGSLLLSWLIQRSRFLNTLLLGGR